MTKLGNLISRLKSHTLCYGMTRGVDLWADPSKRQETGGELWCPKAFNRGKNNNQVQGREKEK